MVGEILLMILSFALAISGLLAGIIMPLLPGVQVAWLGMLLFAYATHFAAVTWKVLLVFLVFVILALLVDFVAPLIGAKKYNASKYGIYGAMIGFAVGVLIMGPIGILAGPAAGAILGEIIYGKEPEEALESSKGVLMGFLAGSAVKFSLVLIMLGYMVYALF